MPSATSESMAQALVEVDGDFLVRRTEQEERGHKRERIVITVKWGEQVLLIAQLM